MLNMSMLCNFSFMSYITCLAKYDSVPDVNTTHFSKQNISPALPSPNKNAKYCIYDLMATLHPYYKPCGIVIVMINLPKRHKFIIRIHFFWELLLCCFTYVKWITSLIILKHVAYWWYEPVTSNCNNCVVSIICFKLVLKKLTCII